MSCLPGKGVSTVSLRSLMVLSQAADENQHLGRESRCGCSWGDDWAQGHRDVEVMDAAGRGSSRGQRGVPAPQSAVPSMTWGDRTVASLDSRISPGSSATGSADRGHRPPSSSVQA